MVAVGAMSSTAKRSTGLRVVEGHAVGDTGAAIVADNGEAVKAQGRHQLDLILRHRPLAVVDVALAARRLVQVAIAAQVGRDHRKAPGQGRRHLVPGSVRLRMAVQQEKRRAAAADGTADAHGGGRDVMLA